MAPACRSRRCGREAAACVRRTAGTCRGCRLSARRPSAIFWWRNSRAASRFWPSKRGAIGGELRGDDGIGQHAPLDRARLPAGWAHPARAGRSAATNSRVLYCTTSQGGLPSTASKPLPDRRRRLPGRSGPRAVPSAPACSDCRLRRADSAAARCRDGQHGAPVASQAASSPGRAQRSPHRTSPREPAQRLQHEIQPASWRPASVPGRRHRGRRLPPGSGTSCRARAAAACRRSAMPKLTTPASFVPLTGSAARSARNGAGDGIALQQAVVEEGQRQAFRIGFQPERQLCQFDRQGIAIDAIQAMHGNQSPAEGHGAPFRQCRCRRLRRRGSAGRPATSRRHPAKPQAVFAGARARSSNATCR